MKKPVIFHAGNTVVRAGNVAGIRGEYLDRDWKAVMTDGTTVRAVQLQQQSRQSFKVQIPEDFADGVYTLQLLGDEPLTIPFNEPKVRWLQGDEGGFSTPDGWVRVQGECLRISSEKSPFLTLHATDGTEITLMPETVYDDYSVGFALNGLASREYRAVYHNGYAACEAGVLTVAPSPEASWGQQLYDVTEHGLSNESVLDCTEALRALLEKVGAAGGGILYFPRGRYHLTDTFHIPEGVTLRGAGYKYTQIFWTDKWRGEGIHENGRSKEWFPTALPEAMITIDGNVAIEDLDFAAGRIGEFIKVGSKERPGKNVRLDRVRLFANLVTHNNPYAHKDWFKSIFFKEIIPPSGGAHDILDLNGSNIKIRNCSFSCNRRIFTYGNKLEYFLLQDTEFKQQNFSYLWMPMGEQNKAIIERIEAGGYDGGCGGDNVYMSHMHFFDTTCGDREAFTTDISSGIKYHGPVVCEPDGRFTFPDAVDMSARIAHPGSKFCILSGTGAGQYRTVTEVEGHTVTVDSPFDVNPAEDSHVTINEMKVNWYCTNWIVQNCGMVQFYTAQGNTVVDGFKIIQAAGIKPYGQLTYGAVQNNWYNSIIRCEFLESNYFHTQGWMDYHDHDPNSTVPTGHRLPGYSFLYVMGRPDELIHLGCVLRSNTLKDNSMIYVRSAAPGSVTDLIIDGNHSEDCRCGIYIEGEPKAMLLNGNTAERVQDEVIYYPSWGVDMASQGW